MLARARTTSLACAQSPKPLSDARADSKERKAFAPEHRNWNVTFCDENVTSLIFVPVTHSNQV